MYKESKEDKVSVDLETIKQLMEAMEEKGMTKVSLKDKSGFELKLERGSSFEVATYAPMPVSHQAPSKLEKQETPKGEMCSPSQEVTSPMVGTFYTSSSPDAEPFVKVGDKVTEETVIGIIEAMKVMNEIKAGKTGTIKEILIDNAHPVEFGTKLLKLV
jgi:acetyl-CoA carboxylase biotin carboxyl carrier protein